MKTSEGRLFAAFLCVTLALGGLRLAVAQPAPASNSAAAAAKKTTESKADAAPVATKKGDLVVVQTKVGKDFKDVEVLILRLAESYNKSDPKKAALLRQAFAASKERRIEGKFNDLVELLAKEQLFNATKSQAEVQLDLAKLLELILSGEHDKQLANEKARIKEYIARVTQIIKREEENRAQTQGEGNPSDLAKKEAKNAERVAQLARDIERTEGKGGKNDGGKNENGKNENGKNNSGKNDNGDSKSGDSKLGDSKSADGKSGDNKSGKNDRGNQESGKNESGKNDSGDNKSGDSKSGDSKSQDSKSGDSKSGKNETGKKESGKNESGKSEAGDSKSGDSKSGDSKSGDNKSGDSKSGKNESGKNESGKKESGKSESGDSKSGDSKSGDSKSGDSKSGDSKSGKSESGKSESGKSQSGDSESGDVDKGDSKSGNTKSGNSKSGDSKSGDAQGGDTESGDSPPGEINPWSDDVPAKKRLKAAEDRMKQAKLKLEQANRKGAAEEQKKAIEELNEAKRELEEILRQLREEEIERMLAQLEARFRKMLEMQVQVHAGTLRLDRVPESARGRDEEIEATRLSRREKQIMDECDKAIILLKEEGSAVAFPEAAEQMREDMQQVMFRLEQAKVGSITQSIELDIIKALEEMIAALQKAQKEIQSGDPPPPMDSEGQPEDQPLVDKIAELKMIRALQMRINTRTQTYGKLLKDPEVEQAQDKELIDALERLSDREQRVTKITRDIVVGRNQ